MAKIVLCSGSPRRQELLRRIGIEQFDIRVPQVEEAYPAGLSPRETVEYISREKAEAARRLCAEDEIFITADTMVFLDDARLGKPHDEADALLQTGAGHLQRISATAAQIENPAIRQKADKLGGTCQRIFDYVRQNPKSARSLRKFLNYYLPTLQKLLTTYELMEEQGVEGENITASKTRISEMLDTMDQAFEKQLDALFGDTALDIDTDITVMEGMLAQEGLTENGKMPGEEQQDIRLEL